MQALFLLIYRQEYLSKNKQRRKTNEQKHYLESFHHELVCFVYNHEIYTLNI